MTVEINSENFDSVTSSEGIVLVDCWAPWCRNCDQFEKCYSRAAGTNSKHLFATLNTQEHKDVRTLLGIQQVPSLLVFRDGVLLFNQPGSYDEAALKDIITQAESLDMNLVLSEIASATSG